VSLNNVDAIRQLEYRELLIEYSSKLLHLLGGPLRGILVFGSVAKGAAKPLETALSDIDLIVVLQDLPPLSERMRMYMSWVLEYRFPSLIQPVLMTPGELNEHVKARAGWIMDALCDGIILYDPDGFVAAAKENLLRELREKGVKRTTVGWVWPIAAGQVVEL